jgi:hypothetical protein
LLGVAPLGIHAIDLYRQVNTVGLNNQRGRIADPERCATYIIARIRENNMPNFEDVPEHDIHLIHPKEDDTPPRPNPDAQELQERERQHLLSTKTLTDRLLSYLEPLDLTYSKKDEKGKVIGEGTFNPAQLSRYLVNNYWILNSTKLSQTDYVENAKGFIKLLRTIRQQGLKQFNNTFAFDQIVAALKRLTNGDDRLIKELLEKYEYAMTRPNIEDAAKWAAEWLWYHIRKK